MTKKPHEDTRLAKYIERRVLELKPKKSQLQIAGEAGFANARMIAMIKDGATKLALDRVPSMAPALESDPAYFLRLTPSSRRATPRRRPWRRDQYPPQRPESVKGV